MNIQQISGDQFYLNIRYHQNNSWQGSLQRLDTGETINFRSELELLHLIEAATKSNNHENEKEKLRQWKNNEERDSQGAKSTLKDGTTGS